MFFSSPSACLMGPNASATRNDGVPAYLHAVPALVEDLLQNKRGRIIAENDWETLFSPLGPSKLLSSRAGNWIDGDGLPTEQPLPAAPDPTNLQTSPASAGTLRQRQYILNLYKPSQGISPHVDLPERYEDGIIGLCLGSGCVMDFARPGATPEEPPRTHSVYLPPRTVYTMTGPARWEWTHGIPARDRDRVETLDAAGEWQTLLRDVRVSITLRWMKEGANVVGQETTSEKASGPVG